MHSTAVDASHRRPRSSTPTARDPGLTNPSGRRTWLGSGAMAMTLRVVAVFVLAAVSAILIVAATPRVARACTTTTDIHGNVPEYGLREQAEEIDLAIVGRPVSQETDGTDQLKVVWLVDHVYKGNVGPVVEIHTIQVFNNCCPNQLTMYRNNEPTVVLARELGPGIFRETGCFGFLGPMPTTADLEQEFGAGWAPDGSMELQAPQDDSGPESVLAVTLAAFVAAILAVWMFAARRRSRREAATTERSEERL